MRLILKALVYRFLSATVAMAVTYYVTGSAKAALAVGAVEAVGKLAFYYAYDIVWARMWPETEEVV